MKIRAAAIGLSFALPTLVTSGAFVPLAAQQESVRYVGELTGQCSGFRGRTVQIDLQGEKLRGVVLSSGGDVRFSGEMKGASFSIVTKSKTPVFIRGSMEGESIRATFERQECSYRAVLKKKA